MDITLRASSGLQWLSSQLLPATSLNHDYYYVISGKLDPVIGRDEEVRRILQIISRRTKNNPVLIGEPGVISPSQCMQ